MASRRLSLEEYTVGWVCALDVELAAAQALLDEEHEEISVGTHDSNIYAFGNCGQHNVVLACLPAGYTGIAPAATIATQMMSSFRRIRFILLVGIGGGVPSMDNDIRLGDVVIGQPVQTHGGVVQYIRGKVNSAGFERTGFLACPPRILLSALSRLRANHLLQKSNFLAYMSKLERLPRFRRDRAGPDILYDAKYIHAGGEGCQSCSKEREVKRPPRESSSFVIHYGTIASADVVMKDAVARDRISKGLDGALCFEMEAAGLMNSAPCLVIRGICDYADSHKNDMWQPYAAGTAAACAREVLSVIPAADVVNTATVHEKIEGRRDADDATPCSTVPFCEDIDFVGRRDIIRKMESQLLQSSVHTRLALVGPSGVGKTQIAVEYSVRVRKCTPKTWVLWVNATTVATFTQSYRDIAKAVKIYAPTNNEADILDLVAAWLKDQENGPWLLIIDNNDDAELLTSRQETMSSEQSSSVKVLADYIPRTEDCSVILTTRDARAGLRICDRSSIIDVERMTVAEGTELFQRKLRDKDMDDTALSLLLENLEYLPLAITQACAFILENETTVRNYLDLLSDSEKEFIKLLNSEFYDKRRYSEVPHSVIKSFIVSFDLLKRSEPRSAELLSRLCYLYRQNIPRRLLLGDEKDGVDFAKALGPLKSFRLLTANESGQRFDMHRLIQLSSRTWLDTHKESRRYMEEALKSVSVQFKFAAENSPDFCDVLPPHAEEVLKHEPRYSSTWRNELLKYLSRYYLSLYSYEMQSYAVQDTTFPQQMPFNKTRLQLYHDLAIQHHKELFTNRVVELGDCHKDTLTEMVELAHAYSLSGNPREARKLARNAWLLSRRALGDNHQITISADVQVVMATELTYRSLLRVGLAIGLPISEITGRILEYKNRQNIKDLTANSDGTPDRQVQNIWTAHLHDIIMVASACNLIREYQEAKRLCLEVRQRWIKLEGFHSKSTVYVTCLLCEALNHLHEFEEAKILGRQALKVARKKLGNQDGLTKLLMRTLARTYYYLNEVQDAKQLQLELLRDMTREPDHANFQTIRTMEDLSRTYAREGDRQGASQLNQDMLVLKKIRNKRISALTWFGSIR